ncbi:MAG: anti-sigma factor antagonist [Verrucomicrobiaceae bacterium]|nr:MAG: anti-sigma factor antagonist [Verrucomicrobiaceae bacterium]
MQIHETKQAEALILVVQGQLDTVSAPQFEARLLGTIGKGEQRICVDCGALNYVNSAGLKAFLVAAKELENTGGKMVLCGLSPAVKTVFDMIGFSQIMVILPTREEAVQKLCGEAAPT